MSGPPSDATIWTRERRYFFTSRTHSAKITATRLSPPHAGDLAHLVGGGGALTGPTNPAQRPRAALPNHRVAGGFAESARPPGRDAAQLWNASHPRCHTPP